MSTTLILSFLVAVPAAYGVSCDSLSALSLPATTITKVEVVAAGAFTNPDLKPQQPSAFRGLPTFCRVAATIRPVSDSEIKIEVWMPAEGWNGKFMGVGNGGWSGAIVYPALAAALARGYAAASTNTGHDGGDAAFAPGHPEKLVDFAYRAVHEMTVRAKAVTEAYYGKAPARAYWNGCSSGGKQGLKEAQKFPRDYDGIVAGAPANYWTHLMAGDLWPAVVTRKDPDAALPPAKLEVLHKAALAACDKLDGVEDGLLEDPSRCRFDPAATVQCRDGAQDNCLSAAQVEAARKIYGGARNPRTGKQVFPGMPPGSELVWTALAGPKPFGIPLSHFRHVVFNSPDWDFLSLDFDKDVALADSMDKGLNATDPNLKEFFARGGKLIVYHGWNDQLIAAQNSIDYYNSVAEKMGGAARIDGAFRLLMAPGMNHCSGGDGPSRLDAVAALEQWVEQGKAPDRIVASHVSAGGQVDRTRPLCAYPQVARYTGSGNTDDAVNFTCARQK